MNSQYETLKIDKTYKPKGEYPLINGPCKSCPKGTTRYPDSITNSVRCKGCDEILVSGSTTFSPFIDSNILINNISSKGTKLDYFMNTLVIENMKPSNDLLNGIHDVATDTIKCQDCSKVLISNASSITINTN
jgi:ribosomal protein S27E